MTKFSRTSSGKYSVNSKMYDRLIGTRAQVMHGTAYKTSGGLTKMDLIMNKHGRIVSKTKHNTAKRENRLVKAGYTTKKGHFGFVKKSSGMKMTRARGSRKHKRHARGCKCKMCRTHMRGGGVYGQSVAPSSYSGEGTGFEPSVGVQFAAGNGN
jgi:hypothetical protein